MLLEMCCFSKAVKGLFERRDGWSTHCSGPLESSDLQAGAFKKGQAGIVPSFFKNPSLLQHPLCLSLEGAKQILLLYFSSNFQVPPSLSVSVSFSPFL